MPNPGRGQQAKRGTGVRGPILLATALMIVAVLWPPELHPWSGAVCAVMAAAGLWSVAAAPGAGLGGAIRLAGFAPFALVALRGAANRAAAIDEAALIVLLLLAALCGRSAGHDAGDREALLRLLVVLGSVVAFQALWQTQVTYPRLAAAVRAVDPADPSGVLVRLESGRATGPFLLPAAFGGFLALALPAALRGLLVWRGFWRGAAGAAAFLIVSGFVLGRSMGAILAAAAGVFVGLPLVTPRHRVRTAAILAVAALIVAGVFAVARLQEIRDPAGDPFGLRAGNWAVAAAMLRDAPWFGTGPGSFASFYPRYREAGMNETRHAHNSFLEAAAGWGAWILVPIALLIVAWWRRARSAWRDPGDRTTLICVSAGTAFLVHNLVDFTAYLPGVAIPAALLIGSAFAPTGASPVRMAPPTAAGSGAGDPPPAGWPALLRASMVRASGVVLTVMLALHGVTAARSRHDLDHADAAVESGELAGAERSARAAAELRPEDPAPHAFLAQMVLAEQPGDAPAHAAGRAAAAAAVARDPESAILHYTLAQFHRAAGEGGAAFRELSEARRLNPSKLIYREAITDPPSPALSPHTGDSGP